jgi:hypothetical protein
MGIATFPWAAPTGPNDPASFCKPPGPFIRLIPETGGVSTPGYPESVVMMSFLSRLFSKNQPKQRIRVCVECGMPIAEHKQWCSILRGQQELDRKAQAASAAK